MSVLMDAVYIPAYDSFLYVIKPGSGGLKKDQRPTQKGVMTQSAG